MIVYQKESKKNWHVNDEENGSRKGRGKFTYMRKVGRFFPIMFDNESSRRVLVESRKTTLQIAELVALTDSDNRTRFLAWNSFDDKNNNSNNSAPLKRAPINSLGFEGGKSRSTRLKRINS